MTTITENINDYVRMAREKIAEEVRGLNSLNSLNSEVEKDFTIKEWPRLSPKARTGIAGDFVELATRKSEADPAALLATFLIRFGIECGPGPHLMIGDTAHYPRLNAVIAGNSSKARKGTSGRPVTRSFDLAGQVYTPDNPLLYVPAPVTPGPLSSGEGLIYAVRDEIKAWHVDKKTGKGQWITVDPGVEDKRLFVLDEELAAALQCTRREGNTLSTVIRSAFDNGTLAPLTKTNRIQATGAHIGIVAHITIHELNKLLEEIQTINGFANRIMWICARRQKLVPIPEPMPEAELRKIQQVIIRLISTVRHYGVVIFSPSAMQRWIDLYPIVSAARPGLVGCVTSRAETILARLSLVYALLDGSKTIELKHLESALAMWAYAKDSAEYIFAGRAANPIAQTILDACERGPISVTDVYGLLSNHATKRQVEIAVQELVTSGEVDISNRETAGRPKKILSLANKAKEAKEGYTYGDDPQPITI